MDNSLRLRPLEITRLRIRYESFLDLYEWDLLFRYSCASYARRGYKKFHNTMVRKLYRQIKD